ncbi:MAG: gamma carbonic anhydrase family protein [Alphaproteobacteria bacterium]|nr:gamma carbonic anhydrase family protein [Alphaproteobacteria bacterium]
MAIYDLGDLRPELPAEGTYWVAESAAVIGRVRLAAQAGVWFGAVLRGDNELISIGERSNVQDNSVLHTDPGTELIVGAGVTVGHSCVLHSVTVGDNSLIGIGAVLLTGARIGKDCLVGAGALVPGGREIPDGSLVLGAPAKVVRPLSAEEIAFNRVSAEVYVRNWQRYASSLKHVRRSGPVGAPPA